MLLKPSTWAKWTRIDAMKFLLLLFSMIHVAVGVQFVLRELFNKMSGGIICAMKQR